MKKVLNNTTALSVGFLVVFVVSNTYFGWNRDPESTAEWVVDVLKMLILYRLFYLWIVESVVERVKEMDRSDSDD